MTSPSPCRKSPPSMMRSPSPCRKSPSCSRPCRPCCPCCRCCRCRPCRRPLPSCAVRPPSSPHPSNCHGGSWGCLGSSTSCGPSSRTGGTAPGPCACPRTSPWPRPASSRPRVCRVWLSPVQIWASDPSWLVFGTRRRPWTRRWCPSSCFWSQTWSRPCRRSCPCSCCRRRSRHRRPPPLADRPVGEAG